MTDYQLKSIIGGNTSKHGMFFCFYSYLIFLVSLKEPRMEKEEENRLLQVINFFFLKLIFCYNFLAGLSYAQDELLWSLFIRCLCICLSINIFKRLLLWSLWANFTQISYGASLGWGMKDCYKCAYETLLFSNLRSLWVETCSLATGWLLDRKKLKLCWSKI